MNDMTPQSTSESLPSVTRGLLSAIPQEFAVLLGPPPVVWGESADHYSKTLLCIAQSLDPRDALDWLTVKDIADAVWEAQRMQRYIGARVKVGMPTAARTTLGRTLTNLSGHERALDRVTPHDAQMELAASRAILNDRSHRKTFARILKASNSSEGEIAAHSYADQFYIISELEQNKARCDDKKARLLRDYERRRVALGKPLARIGTEVTDLPPGSVS